MSLVKIKKRQRSAQKLSSLEKLQKPDAYSRQTYYLRCFKIVATVDKVFLNITHFLFIRSGKESLYGK